MVNLIDLLKQVVAQDPFDWNLFAVLADVHEEVGQIQVARVYRQIWTRQGKDLSSTAFAYWLGYKKITSVRRKSFYLGLTPSQVSWMERKPFTRHWPKRHVMLTPAWGRWFLWEKMLKWETSIQTTQFDAKAQIFDGPFQAEEAFQKAEQKNFLGVKTGIVPLGRYHFNIVNEDLPSRPVLASYGVAT